jgi:hypothetical protein
MNFKPITMKPPKNLQSVILFSCLSVIVFSCKKDEDNSVPAPIVYDNYSQLKVGNYWIYQRFDVDSSGNATPATEYDSCYVEKDTLINNITYYKMIRPNPYIPLASAFFLRDSLHYVVDYKGKILFSSMDFTTTFEDFYQFGGGNSDTVCHAVRKMTEKDWNVTTPAGTYVTSNSKLIYNMYPAYSFAGNVRTMNTCYSKNIGIVKETLPFFASNPNYIERRLVRYHLN